MEKAEGKRRITNLLVPGGLGFIGSHTVVHLLTQTPLSLILIDDLSNCFPDVLQRIQKAVSLSNVSEEEIKRRLRFHQANILDL